MTDLFHFVNGPWLANHVIPDDRATDGTFYQLRDQAEEDVHVLVQEAKDSRAGRFYASYMDTAGINEAGIAPIATELSLIDVPTIEDFVTALGQLERVGIPGVLGGYVAKDSGSENTIAYLYQAGLGLPDEAYYRDEQHAEILSAYQQHVEKMLSYLGLTGAEQVVALEKELAAGHWDVVTTRDSLKTYNPTEFTELPAIIQRILIAAGYPKQRLVVMMPSYVAHVAKLLTPERLEDWKLWAKWQIINKRAPVLTEEIARTSFDFYGTALTGATKQRDRWKRALAVVEGYVGDDIGQLFVAKHFPASAKEEMLVLVDYLLRAYRERITKLPWMTPATREKALAKLEKFHAKIGYPDTWRDYGSLDFSPKGADLVANVKAGEEFSHDYELAKLGKPVDRSEWFSTPQTVNAFYNPTVNDITFPAAILRPPFFSLTADAAENFGAIGAVIGHEIGHGFDDQGSQYDGEGNLESWWTDEDRTAFTQLTAKLVEQFQGLVPEVLKQAGVETNGVNGEFTLGENIGDLGGLGIAVVAYQMYLADHGESKPRRFVADDASPELYEADFTGLQRLFLAWSHVWRMKSRPEMAAQLLAIDPHSPAEFRCNVIAGNVAEFYEAFDVPKGAKVYIKLENRVTIW